MQALSMLHTCRDARVVEISGLAGAYDMLVFSNRSNADAKADTLNSELDGYDARNYMWVIAEGHGGYVVQKRDRHTNRIIQTF